ncbi:serine hydrolase domain-containing protein [Gemmata sp. JC717]|uniref:serine hydrolase domain-containing protein n=1 Tax=Gemmata algarum TaxID=2975278 RepID=UPI0021BB89B8|nr:serine hydrolase domain-containing protein [Gemmata algarum]MDY3554035.1 serine hydrolase domain-containing protein [Gemmata algarum]
MNAFRPKLTPLEDRALASAGGVALPAPLSVVPAAVRASAEQAQRAPAPAVLTDLEGIREQADLPALAGGLVVNGRLEGTAATGVRERGRATPVGADDQFHLGSNGKAMTATLAAVLVERGLLRWTTTLGQALPEVRGGMSPAYRNVTLEQLLNHRGGFIDENVSADLLGRLTAFRGNGYQARQTFLRELLRTPAGAVGEFSYSNGGYALAAALMERATGNSYEWLMQKYVFNPLGMTSAGFGAPGRGYGLLDQPRGHDASWKSVGNGPGADLPAALNPAGLMHMSMGDWSKFLRVHLGERVNGVKLLSAASLSKLHTPDPRPVDAAGHRYGFGWVSIQTDLGPALWHDGSNGFWHSEALLIPSKGVAAFAVTNQAGAAAEAGVGAALAALLARAER